MKSLLVVFIAFLSPITFYCQQANNEEFDKNINTEIIKYNYSSSIISDADFVKLKKKTNEDRPLKLPNSLGLDAFSLVQYIDLVDLDIDKTVRKYRELHEASQLYFFTLLLCKNSNFLKKNRLKLVDLVREIKVDEFEKTIKEILIFYCLNKTLDFNNFEKLLNDKKPLNHNVRMFLHSIMALEKETEFGYQLLLYLRKNYTESDVLFVELRDTKNRELLTKYKSLLRGDLLEKCTADLPDTWDLYGFFLGYHFDKNEIIDICTQKKAESGTCYTHINGELTEISPIDKYVSGVCYFQSAYFSIDSTIDLIEKSSVFYNKLTLIETLSNVRFDLSEKQKKRLLNQLLAIKDDIKYEHIERFILSIRGIDQAISLDFIKENFVKIADSKRLEFIYKATKYNFKDVVSICDKLAVFLQKVVKPIDDFKKNYIADNFEFRLNSECIINDVFRANKSFVELDIESGESITPYDNVIKNGLENVVLPADLKLDILHGYKWLDEKKTESTITIKAKNKIYSIQIIDDSAYPNNKAVYLLLNKVLMDANVSSERFVRMDKDESRFTLVLMEPNKFVKFCNALNEN